MSSKGNNRHVKRLAVGIYPRIERKTATYLIKPRPGRHGLESSVALLALVRDKLGLASRAKEARGMIEGGKIEVNGSVVRDEKYPVGFGDIVTLKPTGEAYSIGVGRNGGIRLDKAEKKGERTLKVIGKYVARGKRTMVRLFDGSAVESAEGVSVNDSVVLSKGKIAKTIKFEQGAKCLVIRGTHASESGTISEIVKGSALRDATVRVEGAGGRFETTVENVMVVGA
jgi:small subunit ribosomal protein S4e